MRQWRMREFGLNGCGVGVGVGGPPLCGLSSAAAGIPLPTLQGDWRAIMVPWIMAKVVPLAPAIVIVGCPSSISDARAGDKPLSPLTTMLPLAHSTLPASAFPRLVWLL